MRPELILSKLATTLLFKNGKNSISLKPGDTVNAKIVKMLDDKHALLNIKGTFLKAKIPEKTNETTVKLFVKTLNPNVVFEILPSKIPIKATFIKIQNANPKKVIKELIQALSNNTKLKESFFTQNNPAFLQFIFENSNINLSVEWFEEKENKKEKSKTLRLIFNTPSLQTSVIEIREYTENLFVNCYFGNDKIIELANTFKEDFQNETKIHLNFLTLTNSQKNTAEQILFNSKFNDTSFDIKI
jgi:hypothetical protein